MSANVRSLQRDRLRSIKERQHAAEAEVTRLTGLQRGLENLKEVTAQVGAWCGRAKTNLEHLTFDERRLMLEVLDVTVVVTPTKWEVKGSLPALAGDLQSYVTIERTSA